MSIDGVGDWVDGRTAAYSAWSEAAAGELSSESAEQIALVAQVESAQATSVLDDWGRDGTELQAEADRLGSSIEIALADRRASS